MSLKSSARLGPYEIISAIGVGGMSEVYRAKDTRLDRIVALKVLPEHRSALRHNRGKCCEPAQLPPD
jgi:eukaryotic-like serine/threonine-protein kinase